MRGKTAKLFRRYSELTGIPTGEIKKDFRDYFNKSAFTGFIRAELIKGGLNA